MPWHVRSPRPAGGIRQASLPLTLAAALAIIASGAGAAETGSPDRIGTEEAFSARAGEELRVIGYDLFGFAPADPADGEGATPLGGAPSGYRLGPGDRLSVTIMDDPVRTQETVVDQAGRLIVPGLPPISVAGASLEEAARRVAGLVGEHAPGTAVDLVLSQAREIDVLVVGSVRRPGRVRLPAFASVLDALFAAGGIRHGGSLRAIRHIGQDGAGTTVDLFDLLETGTADADAAVHAGDRIVVPALGPAVAVAGAVMRPGIYELASGATGIDADRAVALAGGLVAGAPPRLARLTTVGGRDRVLALGPGAALAAGDILLVGRVDGGSSAVLLEGHVASPGPRAAADVPTLGALLSGDGEPRFDAYRPFGILSRPDPQAGGRRLDAFDLDDAETLADLRLEPGDRVGILGPNDVAFLTSDLVLGTLAAHRVEGGCPAIALLARSLSGRPLADALAAPEIADLLEGTPGGCTPLFEAEPDWLAFAVRRSALVAGDADRPGLYPVARATAIGRSGAAAGEKLLLRPGEIAVLARPSVDLVGHVRVPGRRALETAPTLATLIAADGGARDGLYPLLGVIARTVDPAFRSEPLGFVPRDVIGGHGDMPLSAGDVVYLFSVEDALRLADGPADGRDSLPPEVRRFVAERVVSLTGAVRRPGHYPIAGTTSLERLFEAAGGLGDDADLLSIALVGTRQGRPHDQSIALDRTPAATVALVAGDAVSVPARVGSGIAGEVMLAGEFRRPGRYALRRGDRLSDLIVRAGGLTTEAYPSALVLARPSEAARERDDNLAEAAALEAQLEAEIASDSPPPPALVAEARDAARRLAGLTPLGRITVPIGPDGAVDGDADPYLEPGDRITVPRRPTWVAVEGEVLAPGRFAHRRNGSVDAYIDLAGGTTAKADRGRIILIGPDGEAAPRASGFFGGFEGQPPEPGSVVLVPAEAGGPDTLDLVDKVTRVVGQIAVTAATIAILAP